MQTGPSSLMPCRCVSPLVIHANASDGISFWRALSPQHPSASCPLPSASGAHAGTVKSSMDHPTQGHTQMFRRGLGDAQFQAVSSCVPARCPPCTNTTRTAGWPSPARPPCLHTGTDTVNEARRCCAKDPSPVPCSLPR